MVRAAPLRMFVAMALLLAPASPVARPGVASPPDEDGYELWMRYRPVSDAARRDGYRRALTHLLVQGESPTLSAAREELASGLGGLLGTPVPVSRVVRGDGAVVAGTPAGSPLVASLGLDRALRGVGDEGFLLRSMPVGGRRAVVIAANRDVGVLYGAFDLLRRLQTGQPLEQLAVASAPRIRLRALDHWDNLDGSVERGYAGGSLWDWDSLPGALSPRYRDYARANASLGINGVVLTNVNANSRVLTAPYVARVAALANVFRPYGLRVWLTARFSAPLEIGGLATADPLDAGVRAWWRAKADEI